MSFCLLDAVLLRVIVFGLNLKILLHGLNTKQGIQDADFYSDPETTSSGLVAKLTTWQSGLEVRITVVFLSAYH